MRFLFATWDGGGNVPPTLTIASRLAQRGHEVRVLGPRSLRPAIAAAGCSFAPYRSVANGAPLAAGTGGAGRLRAALLLPELARSAPSLAFAQDVLAEIARLRADALVVDFMIAGAIAAGECAGLPTAALMHTVYCLPAPRTPPFGPGWKRRSSPASALRNGAVSALARAASWQRLGELNATRRALALDPVDTASHQLARLARVLVLTSEAFDPPPPALPPNVRYVGPQLDDFRGGEDLDLPSPEGERRPLVLVSFSTRFPEPHLIQRVLDGLAGLRVRILVTLGPSLGPDRLRMRDDVALRRFVPHGAVLPHARLVVTHAGLGTVMASLAHAVPLLCLPVKNDQFENAARVVAAGAGLARDRRAPRRSLRRAVVELLSDPRYAAGARRMAEAVGAYDRDLAVQELESLVPQVRPVASLTV
jgi:MGT family glycosyltransferase